MSGWHTLGDCTIELTVPAGGSSVDFSGEFKNVAVAHGYESIGEKRRMLDGTKRLPKRERADLIRGDTENDLTAAGLYATLQTHDLADADIVVTHLGSGASWTGTVTLTLPADIGASEYSEPVVSSIEWEVSGDTALLAFAAGVATP